MGQMSFRIKISLLCLFLLGLLGGIGFIGLQSTNSLVGRMDDIAAVQLPAVRNMSLADMMHDGLRAVVYRALLVSVESNPESEKEVREELKEMSDNLREYVGSIEALNVRSETKAAIQQAKPEIEAYAASANEIVQLSFSG